MSKQECISKIIVEHCKLHKDLKILNENTNECMICCNKFEGNIVQVRNNLCKCFNTVLLCEKCFVTWFLHDNKCFICRKLYLSKNSNNKYYACDLSSEMKEILMKRGIIYLEADISK